MKTFKRSIVSFIDMNKLADLICKLEQNDVLIINSVTRFHNEVLVDAIKKYPTLKYLNLEFQNIQKYNQVSITKK